MKKSFADILSGLDAQQERKVARKLPEWAGLGLEFPSKLSLEQCSSTATAMYKAELAAAEGSVVCDLTGGLGVDSWAFAQKASKVFHFERNPELSAAAGRNFVKLGLRNVETRCEEVGPETEIPRCDLVYADPARRDGCGRKVFLLEDCTPDILTLLPSIWEKAPKVLLKLSPMADIPMLSSRLGERLKEVHIVSLGGEVKELLCLMEREHTGKYSVKVADLDSKQSFSFTSEEAEAAEVHCASEIRSGDHLLEPCAALMKSGAYGLISLKFGAGQIDCSTHLYTAAEPSPSALLKSFRIKEILPFSNASFKAVRRSFPHADLTARNLPLTTEELRRKLGITPGADPECTHIFACGTHQGKVLIITVPE